MEAILLTMYFAKIDIVNTFMVLLFIIPIMLMNNISNGKPGQDKKKKRRLGKWLRRISDNDQYYSFLYN